MIFPTWFFKIQVQIKYRGFGKFSISSWMEKGHEPSRAENLSAQAMAQASSLGLITNNYTFKMPSRPKTSPNIKICLVEIAQHATYIKWIWVCCTFFTDKIHIKKWTHRVQQICANEGDKTVMCGKPPLHSLIKSPSSSVMYKAFRGFARICIF